MNPVINKIIAVLPMNKKGAIKFIIWSIAIAMFLFLLLAAYTIIRPPVPKIISLNAENIMTADSLLVLGFDMPVSRQIQLEIQPQVYGQMEFKGWLYQDQLARKIEFTPEITWLPDTTYTVRVAGVRSAFPSFQQPEMFELQFTTEDSSGIAAVNPSVGEIISPYDEIIFALDKPNSQLAVFDFFIEPAMDFAVSPSEDLLSYTFKPDPYWSQGQSYQLTVTRKNVRHTFGTEELAFQGEPETVWEGEWKVREAPLIEQFLPNDAQVGLKTDIEVTFSETVDFASFKESTVIAPELTGVWETEDNTTMRFVSAVLTADTVYTVTMKAGLKTGSGGFLSEDILHNFTTIGPVRISASTPAAGGTGVGINSDLSLTFDQAVDQPSVESRFRITPTVAGGFSWGGQKMTFNPDQPLDFNINYRVSVAAGVKSVNGFDSAEDFNLDFATEYSVTKLAVPFHRQEHNLSCEAATLVMALKFHGVSVSEQALIDAIGFDETKKANGVWGNPHVAFVGDIDGHQPSTGYGVYWQPIAATA